MRRVFWMLAAWVFTASAYSQPSDVTESLKLQGEVSGAAERVLQCVAGRMVEALPVSLTSAGQGIADIKAGLIDGLISTGEGDELDTYTTSSAPFVLEEWYWYFSGRSGEGSFVPSRYKLGAVKKSAQYYWLEAQGLRVSDVAESSADLLQLLVEGRVDAVLMDEKLFSDLNTDLSEAQSAVIRGLAREFERYAPVRVQFADHFLSGHPAFLAHFNRVIEFCTQDAIRLSNAQRQQVMSIYEFSIRRLAGHPEVIRILEWQNRERVNITHAEIDQLDSQWREELSKDIRPMINAELSREISRFLRQIQDDSEGLFTEIFLVGKRGLNAGQSNVTSDFYQGDEEPYQATLGSDGRDVYIGPISYDASSEGFQVKLSARVLNGHGEPIGMMMFGIDAERAFQPADTER